MATRFESIQRSVQNGEAAEKALLAAELAGVAAYLAVAKVVSAGAGVRDRIRDRFYNPDMYSYVDTNDNY